MGGCALGTPSFPSQLPGDRVSVGAPLARHSSREGWGIRGCAPSSYSSQSLLLDEVFSEINSNSSGVLCGVGKLRPGALLWWGN